MNITVENSGFRSQCTLTITEGAAKISEDVAEYRRGEGYKVPEEQIVQLLDAAYELHAFNDDGVSFLVYAAKWLYGDDWIKALLELSGDAE